MTTTATIDAIKSLRYEAANFGGFHDLYAKNYAPDTNCDKKGYGFGKDSRFAAFTINTQFSSWHGYYGNSSCSNIMNVRHADLVKPYLVKALNHHQRELFATVARLMREDAAAMTEKAEAEISALSAMIEEAKIESAS